MKQRYFRNLSLGLLAALTALACILTACPTSVDDTPAKTYTVTFNVDNGSAVDAQKVEEGKTVTKPANPTKKDNTFAGWYKDSNKTTLWSFGKDVVVQDTTLYAKWRSGTVPSYKVTFDVDGGTPVPDPVEQSVLQGEPVEEPPKPTKTGFVFDGWYKGGNRWYFDASVTEAITLKARWIELKSDDKLAGIWKLTDEDGQDYYWTLDKDGKGTFHTLGAKVPVSFPVTEGRIDGDSYTVSPDGKTLTLYENVLTKVDSVLAGTGAGGDSNLHGSWKYTGESTTATLTFNSDGTGVLDQRGSYSSTSTTIWKAAGSKLYLYYPDFGSPGGYGMSYTVSGSTFTTPSGNGSDMVFTKQ